MKDESTQLNLRIKINENSLERKPEISLHMSKTEVGIVLNNKWSEQAKCVTVTIQNLQLKKRKGQA